MHLGRALLSWRHVLARRAPLAVEVGSTRVDAQVAADAAVRVHIWDDVEGDLTEELNDEAIARATGMSEAEQAREEAFGKE